MYFFKFTICENGSSQLFPQIRFTDTAFPDSKNAVPAGSIFPGRMSVATIRPGQTPKKEKK